MHPRLTLLWNLQTTFLKTTLMWILNSHLRCALKCRMCLEQYLIPTMALRLIIVNRTLNSMWNITTYTCLSKYWRRFSKQHQFSVAMNNLSQPARRDSVNEKRDSLLLLHIMTTRHTFSQDSSTIDKKAVLSQRWPRDARYISKSWAVAEIWSFEIIQDGSGRHLEFIRIKNSAIRSSVPENPTLEQNMKWIGRPVAEISPLEIFPTWRWPPAWICSNRK